MNSRGTQFSPTCPQDYTSVFLLASQLWFHFYFVFNTLFFSFCLLSLTKICSQGFNYHLTLMIPRIFIPSQISLLSSRPYIQHLKEIFTKMPQIELTLISLSSTPKPNPCTISQVERRASPFIHSPSKTCKCPSFLISNLPLTDCHVFLIQVPEYLQAAFLSLCLPCLPHLHGKSLTAASLVSSFLSVFSQSSRCNQYDHFQMPSHFPPPPV